MALGFAIVDENTALQKKLDDANVDKISKMDAFKVAVNKFREGDKLMKITRGAVGKQACHLCNLAIQNGEKCPNRYISINES